MYDVVVLGSNGQLGSDLIDALTSTKLKMIGLTRNEIDVLNDNIHEVLSKYPTKVIVNCIATTNVDGCELDSNSAFIINSSFVAQLAKYAKANDIKIFHISTDYVFDGTKVEGYTEHDKPNPINIYGLSKYAGEMALSIYHDKYFIFRVSSLFGINGASGKGGNFITTMQRLASNQEQVSVIANQYMCPTSTYYIARAITHFIVEDITDYGVYNCVSQNSCSWYDFACAIFKLSGFGENKGSKGKFEDYKFKAARPQYSVLKVDKLNQYYKMPTWELSLEKYFNLKHGG